MAVEAARTRPSGRSECRWASEGFAVEAALGMGLQSQPLDGFLGVSGSRSAHQRLGRRHGAFRGAPRQLVRDPGPMYQWPLGQAEMLERRLAQPGSVSPPGDAEHPAAEHAWPP